ncbi:hypothetical protein GCM10027419_03200 [Pandoraea terrae]
MRGLMRALCTAAAAATPLGLPAAAHAVTLEQHRALVDQFINERHADPLVADCAAHASFVVATLPGYQSVEYGPEALDAGHAKVEPWQGHFDDRKQKIDVSQVVTLEAAGKRVNGTTDVVHVRCGYAEGRMMAFDYTSPLPTVEQPKHAKRTRGGAKSHAVAGKSGGKRSTASASSRKSTSKAAPKSSASKKSAAAQP